MSGPALGEAKAIDPSPSKPELDRASSPLLLDHSPDPISLVREALRRGRLVDDRVFDSVYPSRIRSLSRTHWTPVEVAVRAASLLAVEPRARVLDVGSGVGKFCIVAAASRGAHVHGVEHRPHLVEIAKSAAAQLGVEATFTHGTLADVDARDVDGVYLFNPFEENLCCSEDWIDQSIELNLARYAADVATTTEFLRATRAGTRVVTYCGFGGCLPPEFTLDKREYCAGRLELWIKTKETERDPDPRDAAAVDEGRVR